MRGRGEEGGVLLCLTATRDVGFLTGIENNFMCLIRFSNYLFSGTTSALSLKTETKNFGSQINVIFLVLKMGK